MRKSARYAGSGWTRTKSCGLGLRIGISVISFLTPADSMKFCDSRSDYRSKGSGGSLAGGSIAVKTGLSLISASPCPAKSAPGRERQAGRPRGAPADGWLRGWPGSAVSPEPDANFRENQTPRRSIAPGPPLSPSCDAILHEVTTVDCRFARQLATEATECDGSDRL